MKLNEFKHQFNEDGEAPTNAVAGGSVAGLGVPNPNLPNQAEPGVNKKKKLIPLMSFMRRKEPVK